MGILDFLRGKPQGAPEAESSHGAAHGLQYDPDFIARLTQEHRTLLTLFGAIQTAHAAGDHAAIRGALQRFLLALNMHLAMENSQFYAYLRTHLRKNTAEHMVMNAFWDEMQEIGKIVITFLRKYIYGELTPEMLADFGRELEQIGGALVTRIRHEEEELYSLYQPFPAKR